ncbi:MAG: hypothetical protein HYY04_15770 [Chloroflexi bacterium]|nr:hypothetical protein [Chloroflexota bacterium]
MDGLPPACDPRRFGLDPTEIRQVTPTRARHGHHLYRIECGTRSHILKWFPDPARAVEVQSYALLESYRVPTLLVHGRAEDGLLLEDLASSPVWRLATEADAAAPETGVAVAAWYRALHAAGRAALADPAGTPDFLTRQADALDPDSILEIGRRLGLAADPVWGLAADHIEALRCAMRSLSETFTYNDFHWTNLALSRQRGTAVQAIVYDYHLLGIGLAYSDCRNVAGSLGPKARATFWEAYGPVDEREAILDKPIAALYVLGVALQRPRLPAWAEESLEMVRGGELENDLRRAVEMLTL